MKWKEKTKKGLLKEALELCAKYLKSKNADPQLVIDYLPTLIEWYSGPQAESEPPNPPPNPPGTGHN